MPYEVDRKTGELVPARDLPAEVFQDLDRLDDEQIVAELKGGVLEEYVYSFTAGGQTVVGLSWVGAREAARHYQGIHIGEPKIRDDADSWTIMVQATDRVRDLVLWGAATVAKQQKTRNGLSPDVFAFNKALSKAQRNALLAVLPTTVIVKTIQAFVENKRGVRQVAPREPDNADARPATRQPAPPARPSPPTMPPESAVSLFEAAIATLPNVTQGLARTWRKQMDDAPTLAALSAVATKLHEAEGVTPKIAFDALRDYGNARRAELKAAQPPTPSPVAESPAEPPDDEDIPL